MKQRLFFCVVTAILYSVFYCISILGHRIPPAPTERNEKQHEGEENNTARNAYIEHIHRTAPGTDWRAVELQNRYVRNKASRGRATLQDTAGSVVGEWHEVGAKNVAGRILFVDYLPADQLVYAAADGGSIWRGNENGTNWIPLNNKFQVENIIHLRAFPTPTGRRIIVVSNNQQIDNFFFSDDEGAHWDTPSGDPYATIVWKGKIHECVVANDAAKSIYLIANDSTENALYRSTDFGNTFERIFKLKAQIYGGVGNMDIWTDEDGSGTLYLLAKNKCYKWNNNTMELQGQFTPPTQNEATLCGAEIGGATYLYARYKQTGDINHFFVSDNGGATWVTKGTLNDGMFMKNSFGCSASVPYLTYLGQVNAQRSTNAGDSWNAINQWFDYYGNEATKLHADIPCIRSFKKSNGSNLTLIATDGGIFSTYDNGISFANITLTGMQNGQYYDVYTHPSLLQYVWAGSQDQGFQRANTQVNGLRDFQQLISGDYGHICSGDGGSTIWANYPGFSMCYNNYTQTDFSASWDFETVGHLWLAPLMEDPLNGKKAYFGGGGINGGSHLVHLAYQNQNITATELPFDFGATITAMSYSPVNHSFRYVVNDIGQFFTSPTGATSWNLMTNMMPGTHYFYGNAILSSPTVLGTVYVGGSGYNNPTVLKSTNFGQNFTDMSAGLPPTLCYALACTPDESLIFAATEAGPYVYITADEEWYYLGGNTAPDETYWSVEYIPATHTARFGTYGRGIWDFTLDPSMTTATPVSATTPSFQLFPNPTAGRCTISGSDISKEGTECAIMDMSGKTLSNICIEKTGNQATLWLNDLPAGVYWVEIRNRHENWRKVERIMKE